MIPSRASQRHSAAVEWTFPPEVVPATSIAFGTPITIEATVNNAAVVDDSTTAPRHLGHAAEPRTPMRHQVTHRPTARRNGAMPREPKPPTKHSTNTPARESACANQVCWWLFPLPRADPSGRADGIVIAQACSTARRPVSAATISTARSIRTLPAANT